MRIYLHSALRRFAQGREHIDLSCSEVKTLLQCLRESEPIFAETVLNKQGALLPYVNLYINGHPIADLPQEQVLNEQDDIRFVCSLVGG
jgi:hypothetical protein